MNSDFSPSIPPRFVAFAWRYHPVLLFAPRAGAVPRAWTISTAAPAPPAQMEKTRSPRFLGDPCLHAPLFDPGGPLTPGQFRASHVAFRIVNYVGSALVLSRLYHAAYKHPVYASQPGSLPDHATLGSGWWPTFAGQDFHLLDRIEGFCHDFPST